MLQQSPAPGSQRQSHRDLSPPGRSPRQQQACHVHAGDQQNQAGDAEHERKEYPNRQQIFIYGKARVASDGNHPQILVVLELPRHLPIHLGRNGLQTGPRLTQGHPGFEAGINRQMRPLQIARHEQIGRKAKAK